MSSKLTDYLTKQIFIEKNVVTFRSLSRQFDIHVNVAKKELATFHQNARLSNEPSYATFLISGEAFSKSSKQVNVTSTQGSSMYIDSEEAEESDDSGEAIPETRMTLTNEQDLETARAAYSRIYSEHIYSLSPSPVVDVGLLCGPSELVYTADAKLTAGEAALLGRITGPHIEVGKASKSVASSSLKLREPRTMKPTVAAKTPPEKTEYQAAPRGNANGKARDSELVPSKAQSSGKLDWGKAKTKIKAEESRAKVKVEEAERLPAESEKSLEKTSGAKANAPTVKDFFAKKVPNKSKETAPVQVKKEAKSQNTQAKLLSDSAAAKRGVKRKSVLPQESETEPEPPASSRERTPPLLSKIEAKATYRVKGNAILSDDDEDEPMIRVPKRKGKPKGFLDMDLDDVPSRSEMSLRTMMDVDDDHVEKVSRLRLAQKDASSSDGEEADDDAIMDDESDVPKEKPKRKRKEKKVIPVGKNGLQKKRIEKSRMTTDLKGYMVMEDYSEYESVEEEETRDPVPKAKKPSKTKAVTKEPPSEKTKPSVEKEKEKEPRKTGKSAPQKKAGSTGTKVMHKGSIMNFFSTK